MGKKLMNYVRAGLAGMILGASALTFSGCGRGDFWKTGFIETNMQRVFDKQISLEQKYRKESGIEILQPPERERKSTITQNPDKTYTLFYECQFTEGSNLEKIIQSQIKDSVISSVGGTNQLVVKVKDESQLNYLKAVLEAVDKMPSQVLIKLKIYGDYADYTQDFATHLSLSKQGPRETISTTADFPGAAMRIKGREDIGTKYGFGYEGNAFTIKAILDVLESQGYVEQIYETEMLFSNGEKGSLREEETLPIPTYVVAGQNVVQTYKLEKIQSFFEATPIIYEDGLVQLSFTAGIGGSKRPEGPIQWPVPTMDSVEVNKIYLRVGEPFLVAGKSNKLEVGVVRKDPIIPFLGGKDWEKRVNRFYYEITPFRVKYYEEGGAKPENEYQFKIIEPNLPSGFKDSAFKTPLGWD